MFKCCLCGKSYETERAAVRCVNKCGREKFENKDFIKKESTYRGETVEISYRVSEDMNLKEKCEELVEKIQSKGIATSLRRQLKNWDRLSREEQTQLYEIIQLKI